MNKMKKIMNKLGFTGLLIALFFSVSCECQNFFWSHSGSSEPAITAIKYGYLYNWYATQGTGTTSITSSDDWAVPTYLQYRDFADNLGALGDYSTNSVGGKLKETGITYWDSPNTGATNETGFNARGNGSRNASGTFVSINAIGYIWTSSLLAGTTAWITYTNSNTAAFNVNTTTSTKVGAAIRLLYTGAGTPTTYAGNDGKIYRVVLIGTQYWLADNLAETQLRDGSTITTVTDGATWAGLTTGAKCAYNNDESNVLQ